MMTSAVRIAGAGVLTLVALFCALILSAARSDFLFRGCDGMSRADWGATANCSDAWLAQVLMGVIGFGCLIGAVLIWRRRQGT